MAHTFYFNTLSVRFIIKEQSIYALIFANCLALKITLPKALAAQLNRVRFKYANEPKLYILLPLNINFKKEFYINEQNASVFYLFIEKR